MKKLLSVLLASVLTVSALALSSCGKKDNADGGNEGGNETPSVTVTIVDKVGGKDILSYNVPYEDNATVLGMTVTACASNGLAYELNDDENAFKSIDGLYDFAYSDSEDMNQWHYLLNDHDGIDESDYAPAEKAVAAGDKIVWQYDEASYAE